MKSNCKKLGEFIRLVDERNKNLAISNLQGVSIEKKFIPSIANIIGTDLSNYKIVRTGQFAYGPVTSRNGDKISIALLTGEDCIISSSYVPFEVYRPEELLPDYLMLWFMRPEFDRYARFMSNGSAREVFDWDCMCDVDIPVPPIEEQEKIVHDYKVVTDRIELLKKINDNLENITNNLFRQKFIVYSNLENKEYTNFEFGRYPSEWKLEPISCLTEVKDGTHDSPQQQSEGFKLITSQHLDSYSVNTEDAYYISKNDYDKINVRSKVEPGDILMSMIGTVGRFCYVSDSVDYAIKNVALFKTSHSEDYKYYILCYLKSDMVKNIIEAYMAGSTQSYISLNSIRSIPIIIPDKSSVTKFSLQVKPIFDQIIENTAEVNILNSILKILINTLH